MLLTLGINKKAVHKHFQISRTDGYEHPNHDDNGEW